MWVEFDSRNFSATILKHKYSTWRECPVTHKFNLESRINGFKGGARGGHPRPQSRSNINIEGGVRGGQPRPQSSLYTSPGSSDRWGEDCIVSYPPQRMLRNLETITPVILDQTTIHVKLARIAGRHFNFERVYDLACFVNLTSGSPVICGMFD